MKDFIIGEVTLDDLPLMKNHTFYVKHGQRHVAGSQDYRNP